MASDRFSAADVRTLASRAGHLCSNPVCRAGTSGPTEGDDGVVKIGEAAHICAASPGGPRYDDKQTANARSDVSNGIWLCSNCHTKVDRDVEGHPATMLREWKADAEDAAKRRLGRAGHAPDFYALFRDHCSIDPKPLAALSRDLSKIPLIGWHPKLIAAMSLIEDAEQHLDERLQRMPWAKSKRSSEGLSIATGEFFQSKDRLEAIRSASESRSEQLRKALAAVGNFDLRARSIRTFFAANALQLTREIQRFG